MIDAQHAERLASMYYEMHGATGDGFEADLNNPDLAYRKATSDVLGDELDDIVLGHFIDHEPFLRSFLCKWPGEGSDLYLHRDWTYIDERTGDHTYVVWIPLIDVDFDHGALQVLRHSHRIDTALRGTGLSVPWVDDDDLVRPRLLTVPAPIGHAVIMDNAMVHCSVTNRSGQPRPVAALGIRPRGAPLVHYRRADGGVVERFDVPDSFLLEHTPAGLDATPPEGPVAEVCQLEPPVPQAEVARRLDTSVLTRLDDLRRRRGRAVTT